MRGTVAIVRNDHSRYPEGWACGGFAILPKPCAKGRPLGNGERLPTWLESRNTHGSDEIAPVSFFSKA